MAASATLALKAGVWFRRGLLLIVSPVRGYHRRYQAETPLIDLFKFAEPALSRRLSRYVTCANAITRKCSVQRSVRTRTSPPYFRTMRSKLVHGTKSMTCEKRVRPAYMVTP